MSTTQDLRRVRDPIAKGMVPASLILILVGHPPNLVPTNDQNPFGYRGAYTAGVERDGVICGGPNLDDGSYYDAQDGRITQMADFGRFRLPSFDDLFGDKVDDFLTDDPVGRFITGCAGGGAAAGTFVASTGAIALPVYGQITAGTAALGGCVVGGGLNAEYDLNPIRRR